METESRSDYYRTRKLNDKFEYNGVTLIVTECEDQPLFSGICSKNCYFYKGNGCMHRNISITGPCQSGMREDGIEVYFKLV